MSRLYLRSPIPPFKTADGSPLASSVTLTDISPAPQIVPSAVVMIEAGMEFEVEAYGEFSTTGTPTLLLGFYWGGVAGTALAASSAITTTTTGAAWPWRMHYRGRIRATGTSGSIKGVGHLQLGTSLTAMAMSWIPVTQALRTVTIDTTAAGGKALTVGAQWGTSSASNTATCYDLSCDIAN
jgi:hypothetical protein